MKVPAFQVHAERLKPSGAWQLSTVIWSTSYRKTYYGYTKKEAVKSFRAYVKESFETPNCDWA